ncbi:inosine monophosphate dehydrogenase [Aspergillus heteromorphus CBS 117.55]|uniref:Inosine monophosphate dehydrogenase n=1 Tax=Aspergillus heteromorphus CBS 117.55 TaxID=1448321 RepID=A0A317VF37_9EURO|nr:inosine monophosphate dehydrogenase [Aspergillus heteromorphus CBS 117.55]PWY72986.1 inosine monophosphate dehydrogenase [Aspergillus heteromorphus CBS 117.55]
MSHPLQRAASLALAYPWTTTPLIISAPMRVMAGPALAVAVSSAGGLGFLGPNTKTDNMASDLEEASALLSTLRSTPNIALPPSTTSTTLPIGIGFQLWSDSLLTALKLIKQHKPTATWLFAPANGQKDLDVWTRAIRETQPETKIWIQIGTVSEAESLIAASSEKPDVIVIQGSEAGGHGRASDGMGLMALLPEIVDIVSPSGIPVVAAGGIADGRGASAALCLGASGVVLGTRFLASTEARINPGYQAEVVRARDGATSTTRTLLYNHLRGTYGWPQEYSPRGVVNRSWTEFCAGRPFDELKSEHDRALGEGEKGWGVEGRLATYAGAAVGLVRGVKGAGEIVEEVREEVGRLLGSSV